MISACFNACFSHKTSKSAKTQANRCNNRSSNRWRPNVTPVLTYPRGSDMQPEVAELVVPAAVHSCLHRSLDHTDAAVRVLQLWPTCQLRRTGWERSRNLPALHADNGETIAWDDCYTPEQARLFWQDSHILAIRICSKQFQYGLEFLGLIVQMSRVCRHWYGLCASWVDGSEPQVTGDRQPGDPLRTELPALPNPCPCTWPLRFDIPGLRGHHFFQWRRFFLAELPMPQQLRDRDRLALQVAHRLRFPPSTSGLRLRPGPLDWSHIQYATARRELRGLPDDTGEMQWRWRWCEQHHSRPLKETEGLAIFELIFQASTAIPKVFSYQDRHRMPLRGQH